MCATEKCEALNLIIDLLCYAHGLHGESLFLLSSNLNAYLV